MASRVLSVLLGSEVVKVCEIALAGKKKIQVFNAIDLVIPSGLCEDGVIQDVNELAAAIKEGLYGEGFVAKKIAFALNSKRIANKEITIPFVKENRIKEIININATEYFPVANINEYTLNYSILEVIELEGMKQYRLSVTATPIDLLEDYYALAKALNMGVETIDFAGNSILQLLRLQTTDNVCAILQIGNENTVVNIMDKNVLSMQRSVPYGRSTIADAVKSARNVDDTQVDTILADEDIAELAEGNEEIADSVRMLFNSVSRIIEFYKNRNQERPIEAVKLIGDASSINGLAELFAKESEQNVELIDSLHGVEIKNRQNVTDEIAANYLSNIGAVIAPVGISLVEAKKEIAGETQTKLPWWSLIVATVAALLGIGIIAGLYFAKVTEAEGIQAQIAALGDVENLEQQYLQSQAELETLKDWYNTTKSPNESIYQLFVDLEEVQPSSLSLTTMKSEDGTIVFEGMAPGKRPIAQFEMELKKLPYVKDVSMEIVGEVAAEVQADTTDTSSEEGDETESAESVPTTMLIGTTDTFKCTVELARIQVNPDNTYEVDTSMDEEEGVD